MEKIIKALRIIAYVSIALLIIVFIILELNKENPKLIFYFDCTIPLLILFAIPSLDRPFFSVEKFKIDIQPKTWLKIYSAVTSIYLLILIIPLSYFNNILDIPCLFNKNYLQINDGAIANMKISYGKNLGDEITITTNGKTLRAVVDAFIPIDAKSKYTFIYLPHSKWIVDIVDENGISLLKKRRI